MTRILMQSSDVQVGTRPVQPPMLLEGAMGGGGVVLHTGPAHSIREMGSRGQDHQSLRPALQMRGKTAYRVPHPTSLNGQFRPLL